MAASKSGLRPFLPPHTHLEHHNYYFFVVPAFQHAKKKKKKLPVFRLPLLRGTTQKKKKKRIMLLPQIKCKNQAVSRYTHIRTHVCVHVYILNNKKKRTQTKLSLLVAFCSHTGTSAFRPDLWPPPRDQCVCKIHPVQPIHPLDNPGTMQGFKPPPPQKLSAFLQGGGKGR